MAYIGENRDWERYWEKRGRKDFIRDSTQQINHPIRKIIVSKSIGESVLDVACLTAIDYPLFKKNGFKYTGIDITELFIRRAKELYPGIDVRQGTALKMPFKDKSYDTVYCKDLLEHIAPDDYIKVINEMWRISNKLIMIAFFRAPNNNPTVYDYIINGKTSRYENSYNKAEIIDFLENLKGIQELIIEERIGYNDSALYEVIKKV